MDKVLIQTLYQAFADAASRFTEAGLTPIATIDRFRGQPQHPEQFEFFGIPALFFETQIKWNRVGKVYNGDLRINFHLVTDSTGEQANIATNVDQALNYYNMLALVRDILDNFKCVITSTFERTEDTPVENADVINYDILGYHCTYYDPGGIGPAYACGEIDSLNIENDDDSRTGWVTRKKL